MKRQWKKQMTFKLYRNFSVQEEVFQKNIATYNNVVLINNDKKLRLW